MSEDSLSDIYFASSTLLLSTGFDLIGGAFFGRVSRTGDTSFFLGADFLAAGALTLPLG